jgi:hypothetical protein
MILAEFEMVRVLYCWRGQMQVPMLEKQEAAYCVSLGLRTLRASTASLCRSDLLEHRQAVPACHGGKFLSAANCNPTGNAFQQGFVVSPQGEIMKQTSVLGLAVEHAIQDDPRFRRDRESIRCGAYFSIQSGNAFMIKRTTTNHINFWISQTKAAKLQ